MPHALGGWALLLPILCCLGALTGAFVSAARHDRVSPRWVHGFSLGALPVFAALVLAGVLGHAEPWSIVAWSAPPLGGALLAMLRRLLSTNDARRAVLAAGTGALAVGLAELAVAIPALLLHVLYALAGLCLALPLGVLAERLRWASRWPMPWLLPRAVPLIGAALGVLAAFEVTLAGARAVEAGLRLWPVALGAVATLVPLLRGRLRIIFTTPVELRELPGVAWRHLAARADERDPARSLVAGMVGIGVGALLVLATWGLGLGLCAASWLEGTRLRSDLRDQLERWTRRTTLLRGQLHLVAFVIAVSVVVPLFLSAARDPTPRLDAGAIVYAASVVVMFGTSALYHRYPWKPGVLKYMTRVDHSMIYVFLGGTLLGLVPRLPQARWLVPAVLGGAVVGVLLKLSWPTAPRWISLVLYLTLGWSGLLLIPSVPPQATYLLVAGGVVYTVGAVVYYRQSPRLWPQVFGFHEVLHLATFVAAALHWVAIFGYVLPARLGLL
jgi:hemolysin III